MTGLQGRDEFIFEASADGMNYKEIDFFYKPSDLHRAPSFSIPYHPRLEWQIWFSSFKDYSKINQKIDSKLFVFSPQFTYLFLLCS